MWTQTMGDVLAIENHGVRPGIPRNSPEFPELRHSREVTRVCSPELTHQHAFGADDNAPHVIDLGTGTPNSWWVTLTEQKWVTFRER
jgi:hypothetical protein